MAEWEPGSRYVGDWTCAECGYRAFGRTKGCPNCMAKKPIPRIGSDLAQDLLMIIKKDKRTIDSLSQSDATKVRRIAREMMMIQRVGQIRKKNQQERLETSEEAKDNKENKYEWVYRNSVNGPDRTQDVWEIGTTERGKVEMMGNQAHYLIELDAPDNYDDKVVREAVRRVKDILETAEYRVTKDNEWTLRIYCEYPQNHYYKPPS